MLKSNLRHRLKTCVATNFGRSTNGHLRLRGSVKYLCNMLCLPDCMFANDAAQSIIAFLTVVCRHTGGRYIAPEVSMHNTRATHKCSSKCAQLFAVCTLSFYFIADLLRRCKCTTQACSYFPHVGHILYVSTTMSSRACLLN